jgi:N-acetylneuraminic acid mutarotase
MIRTPIQSFTAAHTVLFLGLPIIGLLDSPAVQASNSGGSGAFTTTGSLNTTRYDHTATLLPSGEVLVTGGLGVDGDYTSLASAELYDPKKGRWTVTGSMAVGRTGFTATLLANGQVLVAGGSGTECGCKSNKYYHCSGPTNVAYLYSFSGNSWSQTGSLNYGRASHTMTLLPSGEVLVTGGLCANRTVLSSAELYTP